ncbi:MAG: macro domain-containing protein [Oscillospiraceae bacterium]|nr:macro domain-containing protein [Oscillospiraceae bacterium]
MPFQIIRNDLTRVRADAIVNSANPEPVIGRGTDMGIYEAAGREELLAERRKIGRLEPGTAAYTPAFRLRAKYIIHTAAPEWMTGEQGERDTLRSCYRNVLELADRLKCSSTAFPLLSSGSNGFPKDEAMKIALSEIQDFLMDHEMRVIMCVMDDDSYAVSRRLMGDIEAYIDSHGALKIRDREYGAEEYRLRAGRLSDRRRNRRVESAAAGSADLGTASKPFLPPLHETFALAEKQSVPDSMADAAPMLPDLHAEQEELSSFQGKSLEEVLGNAGDTFQQRLFKLIDKSGMTDVMVYKKANLDRKVFSRIRSKVHYQPKKETAVALGIALELDMSAMSDLLARAGYAFSPSSAFDLIIEYFVSNRNYDIPTINCTLFEYRQPLLGSIPQN